MATTRSTQPPATASTGRGKGKRAQAKSQGQDQLFSAEDHSGSSHGGGDQGIPAPVVLGEASPVAATEMALEVGDQTLRTAGGSLKALRHPVELAGMTPTAKKLTELNRRLWSFLVAYALAGKDHVSSPEGRRDIWRVPIRTLVADAKFNSKNLEYLRTALKDCQTVVVEWGASVPDKETGETRLWTSTQLLGSISFVIDAAGQHCLEWTFPERLLAHLREFKEYFVAEVEVLTRIRRHSTMALYWIVSRYKTNPGGLTMKLPWRDFVPMLTGESNAEADSRARMEAKYSRKPIADKHGEFRYFKRDVINPAVAELNAVQDEVWVEPVTIKTGRFITHLQFRIHRRRDFRLGARVESLAVDLTAVEALTSLGVPARAAESLFEQHGAAVILQAADITTKRDANKALEPLRTTAGYVQEIIKQISAGGPEKLSQQAEESVHRIGAGPVLSAEQASEQVLKDYQEEKIQQARKAWDEELSQEARDAAVRRFEQEMLPNLPAAVRKVFSSKGLNAPLMKSHFARWLAQDLAGADWNPGPDKLLQFVVNRRPRAG